MRKRKKKWTTKNTQIKRRGKEECDNEPTDWITKLGLWLILISVILGTIIMSLNNHIVGYDHFIGIPTEWVRSLLK